MTWAPKVMRTVRFRNDQSVGALANLLTLIADAGGSVGAIQLLTETSLHVVRDVSVYADSPEQMEKIIAAMRRHPVVKVLDVRDEVLEMHVKGKIAIRSRYPITSQAILRRVYTPGVAEVCMKIAREPELARLYTATSHMVAIVTDGTAVLGLGDIGPLAAMPVMEGKAMLMETLVGLSGIPILLNTKDTEEIIRTVANIAPTFAAIQLEDISAPRCFEIEERLQKMLDIPVLHDDQHGTAVVTTAALMGASRQTGVYLSSAKIGQIGLGAAGSAIAKMLMRITGNPVWGADLNPGALKRLADAGGIPSNLREIMETCDIVVATTGVPGLIKPEMVRQGQIILSLSNPNAEIEPEVALAHGAIFAADGKSVNNVLGFPGIFRGAVDANAREITHEMLVAAAYAIAEKATGLDLVPDSLDKEVHKAVARAVAQKAIEQGVARADYVPYVED
ncbi:MAG: malic enzyme-like NAD(P)-binding protein [Anaerolineales bacterium]|jgi:malate dehydrogenase (oxaloacetate-decarboxylating)|nr:malic enzyme-like NAD(P)-binding protein [Anaerolineales bacterium]